jgi:hypothetical protein
MTVVSRGFSTTKGSSYETGREAATSVLRGFDVAPKLVLTYLTVNHDQAAFLKGLRDVLGPQVPILGCSTQGVIGLGTTREDGFAAGVMALGGDTITVASASVEDIAKDTSAKGKELGRSLRSKLNEPPKITVLLFDPLAGADAELLVQSVFSEVESPILGGGSAHSFAYNGTLTKTFQYFGDRVLGQSAVAFSLSGSFTAETAICHGCSPVGVELTVTRADGNLLLELDGRPALDVWKDICGSSPESQGLIASLAIGIHAGAGHSADEYLVRAAYSMDMKRGGLIMGVAIPVGTRIMLHHRTTEDVLEGAERMARSLRARLADKPIRAVLGFECGARTKPFLGDDDTLKENLMIQREVAPDAAWIGGMFWGELYPVGGRPMAHNYSYPILALAD